MTQRGHNAGVKKKKKLQGLLYRDITIPLTLFIFDNSQFMKSQNIFIQSLHVDLITLLSFFGTLPAIFQDYFTKKDLT